MGKSKTKEVVQYISALGRLYGVVHKDMVKKVYNQQNEQKKSFSFRKHYGRGRCRIGKEFCFR